MDKRTYKYIADRDLKTAQDLLSLKSYSPAGIYAQQAVEKYLKHYIDVNGDTDDIALLTTHNLLGLYNKVVELGGLEYNSDYRKMMYVLRSYYFELNYPGDNFRELGKEEATEAVEFAKELIATIKWTKDSKG